MVLLLSTPTSFDRSNETIQWAFASRRPLDFEHLLPIFEDRSICSLHTSMQHVMYDSIVCNSIYTRIWVHRAQSLALRSKRSKALIPDGKFLISVSGILSQLWSLWWGYFPLAHDGPLVSPWQSHLQQQLQQLYRTAAAPYDLALTALSHNMFPCILADTALFVHDVIHFVVGQDCVPTSPQIFLCELPATSY